MKKILLVVDMQNDFIDGPLGTPEARAIVDNVCAKIREGWDLIVTTQDSHFDNYLKTQEGTKLPVEHCVVGTLGWYLDCRILAQISDMGPMVKNVIKYTFGAWDLPAYINHVEYEDYSAVECTIVGVCTDICVISNALLLKAHYPEMKIVVDAACCAGTTSEKHRMALEVMKSCQVEVENIPEDWVMLSDISEEKMDKILDVMDNYNPELCKYKSYTAGVRDTNCREDCDMDCPYEEAENV